MYIIQLMNYAAAYKGNFFRSLEALEKNGEVTNIYVFCPEAQKERTQSWISELKCQDRIFYLSGDQKTDVTLLKNLTDRYAPKAIHVHFGSTEQFNAAIMAAGRRVTVIRHFHNHSNYGGRSLKNSLRRFLFRRVVMIGCSDSVADSVRADFPHNKVYSVVNAIDYSRLEATWDENRNTRGVMMLGFDFGRKGVDLAVEAVKVINEELNQTQDGRNVSLSIVMASNLEANTAKICRLLGNDVLPDWIRILEPKDNIAEYFRQNGVFLSASREEGFCYAIPEAAYCGCTIVASDTPGQLVHRQIPDVYWFKSGDEESLKDAILRVFSGEEDSGKTENMNREKQQLLRSTYNLDAWAAQITDIYKSL